ncbi:MAG: D-alanyl-D-alanine carboxypeptidase family protein [Parvularculaceae bacterium]|nr:D-alanyl-D-alanine carboxypeptidase family protein [Parvularculaceae bacterium]
MKLRPPPMFACAFLALAGVYGVNYGVTVWSNPVAAESRFTALSKGGYPGIAQAHGERVIALRKKAGDSDEDLAPFKTKVAAAMVASRRYDRGAELYEQALASDWAKTLKVVERSILEDRLARARIHSRDLSRAVSVYAEFLELSGDAASRGEVSNDNSIESFYAKLVGEAGVLFTETLKPTGNPEYFTGARESKLAAANDMTTIGAFFALKHDGLYAAAGLLSSALALRGEILGADHPDTVQIALMLGPVYQRMGRLDDAERLYLDAFHAQEKAKGSNNPELSLYIKLLAGIYEEQGRATEAQALNEHMRALFRDAFGAQRYSANQVRDRRLDIDRPVSQQFPLPASYAPTDLVPAVRYSIPLSKSADLDEMKLRLAADPDDDPREENLPARLAQVISLCRAESGERISLRSGYRSYETQRDLYSRIGDKGTVTPPGVSEHQLGLVADIDIDGRLMRQSDKAYQCFEENAFRFGFILSYPPGNAYLPGKDTYEPWHWRYVGIRTAQLYREAGPNNKPQEFLAALPCYQERAVANDLRAAGEADICLEDAVLLASSSKQDLKTETKAHDDAPAARKLNNFGGGGGL